MDNPQKPWGDREDFNPSNKKEKLFGNDQQRMGLGILIVVSILIAIAVL